VVKEVRGILHQVHLRKDLIDLKSMINKYNQRKRLDL